jgi:hypothetical protein
MMSGGLKYWHLIGPNAPTGSIEDRARKLLDLHKRHKLAAKLAPDISKAMAIDLAAASWDLPDGIPAPVAELVRELCPKWAYVLIDAPAVYSGRHAGRGAPSKIAHERLRSICLHLDIEHARKTAKKMRTKELASRASDIADKDAALDKALDLPSGKNLERTIRRWRAEDSYATDIAAAISMFSAKADTRKRAKKTRAAR